MMKVHQLRYLTALAAEGSIRAAARAQGVSQAAVTQGLQELEAHARVALFTRLGHRVTLTQAGHDLLEHAHKITNQLREAEHMLAGHRESTVAQKLSIGVTPWIAQTLLPLVIPIFRVELPHVQLELVDGLSALGYPKLREGHLDLMISRIPSANHMTGLQSLPLFSYEMTVVARREHPCSQARSLTELLEQDWIINYAATERDTLMVNLFLQHGIDPPYQRIHLAHSASLMLTLVRKTDMLTFCPWPLVESDSLRGHVAAIQLKERFNSHVVGIVRRAQESPSPAASRFIELFLDQVRMWRVSKQLELRRVLHAVDILIE